MTAQLKEEQIVKRYSCRSYTGSAFSKADIDEINRIISGSGAGPFGSDIRFMLSAASVGDSSSLKDLGTYGFIKNPAAFIIGAAGNSAMFLEDYGYVMEKIILDITGMGLGTCWLGGSFRKSSFAARIGLRDEESVPAVVALGYIADKVRVTDRLLRTGAGSKKRMPGSSLFFDQDMKPLVLEQGSGYAKALEMVRLAPSANNNQPWRIIKDNEGNIFHFYVERSSAASLTNRMLKLADLPRVDMGIAMCHFELTAIDNRLKGSWKAGTAPSIKVPKDWHYTASWIGK